MFQLTNRRRRILTNKKRQEANHANLTQDMLNELNKHTLPGYEHYMHYPEAGAGGYMGGSAHAQSGYDDYDTDAAWDNSRYYGSGGGQRYKVVVVIIKVIENKVELYTIYFFLALPHFLYFCQLSYASTIIYNGEDEVRCVNVLMLLLRHNFNNLCYFL